MQTLKTSGIEFEAGRWPLDPARDTIVFIHGSGGTNILWRSQVEMLAGSFNTVALNLPGHGNSDGHGLNRIEDYAQSVSQFIRSIEVNMPVICGLSIGGAIVLQLLIEQRERCKAGIVVNAGARLKVMPLIFEMVEKDYQGFVTSMYTFGVSQKTAPSLLKPLADSMSACPPAVTLCDFTACNTFDVMDRLGKIDVPVLVLTASDDQLTPGKYGRFLAERIQTAEIVNIEDAGHLAPVEKPEEVARAIQTFLAKL
ncbi:MAG: alpha/beta fold hydrolase [Thermodesulfobacteriota bacterium]